MGMDWKKRLCATNARKKGIEDDEGRIVRETEVVEVKIVKIAYPARGTDLFGLSHLFLR